MSTIIGLLIVVLIWIVISFKLLTKAMKENYQNTMQLMQTERDRLDKLKCKSCVQWQNGKCTQGCTVLNYVCTPYRERA